MSNNSILISADGHCGASMEGYRPYLDSRFHDEFDAWANSYSDAWGAVDDTHAAEGDPEGKLGVSSFMSPANWDSSVRQALLEEQGVAAELLFPNTVPPFQPSGSITTPGPTTRREYELRFAGLRAHNRWLADFCREVPGRRAGIAQIFFNDVDAAVQEIRQAKENGLMGILLPSDHFHLLNNLYYPDLFPIWQTCVELDMPVHRHGVVPSEAAGDAAGNGAAAVGLFEAAYFTRRGLAHLVLGGVFERFPELKFVTVESGSSWIIQTMASLDALAVATERPGTVANMFGAVAFEDLTLLPSEYIKRNCWIGSFFDEVDIESRHEFNGDHLMWGADFPHHEGTSPDTTAALRINFSGVPEPEIRSMLSSNAAACYGFDLDFLQKVADDIGGPTIEQIQDPLPIDQYPRWPEDTICPTFASADDRAGFSPGSKALRATAAS